MLHKEIPFLRIGLPLCAGIVSGLYINPDPIILVTAGIIISAGFIYTLFYSKYQASLVFGFALSLTLFICGLILYTNEKKRISDLPSEQTKFLCTLSDFPEEKENSLRLIVKLNCMIHDSTTETVNGSVLLYHRKDSSLTSSLPGDLLILELTPVEITNRGNPKEFDYRFYMENQGVRYYAFTGTKNILSHRVPDRRKLVHKALIIREKIIWMYKMRGITGERLALVAAVTLGQKRMLDPEQKQNFIKAGVMHIMAVSGLHAVILSLFVFNLLFFMKRRFNILRIIITILILWSFAFITGLTPSVLRATLMFSILQAGNLMKRRVNGINSVLASAFVLILIKPSVIFDAGFLLSYSAVIYIILFYRDLYLMLQFRNWLSEKIWQSSVVTIVAQAGTLPLTIMLFNRFPTYFILTNIIIVPLSSLLIITGCLVPMLFPVQFLSHFLALVLNYMTGITEFLTARAASLPLSTIENIGMTTVECILLSITIFLFSYFLIKKQPFSILFPLTVILLFSISVTFLEISTRTTNKLIVYNTPGFSTIGIQTGKILNIYSDTSLTRPEVIRHSAALGLRIRTNNLRNIPYCINTGGKKILICNTSDKYIFQEFTPDIVIFTGQISENEKTISFSQNPESLILTAKTTSGYNIFKQLNFAGTDTIHVISKSGAYIESI